ncbi:phosphatidylinositol-specific phospholipase C [Psychromicrobium sp. YIM B11713]|uniref:phosphatidylinositol-specific phospholipase C n=1 Tax=Psychromicrobium sp. YIM B11713 TaxID=3145233 RepID=UPI00374F5A4C
MKKIVRRTFTLGIAALLATSVSVTIVDTAQAADGSYQSIDAAHNPAWMAQIPDSRLLSELSIPGTHETMAVHGGDVTQTQEFFGDSGGTLARQLEAGIRAIDIRAKVNAGNTFTIHHGAVYQSANFDDVLTNLRDFLRNHPTETVLMRLKHECTGETFSCKDDDGQADFLTIFRSYVDKYPDLFWKPSVDESQTASTPKLGDVRGKLVLAVLNGVQGECYQHYGLFQTYGIPGSEWKDGSSEYVQDNYTVGTVFNIPTKRDDVRRFLDKTNAGDNTKMYFNFSSGSGAGAFPNAVAGGALGVQGVNPFLLIYMNEGHDLHRTGAIMMDFPGVDLINKIISYN